MLVREGVEVKPVEGDPARADRDLGKLGPHLRVELIAAHAEIPRGVSVTDKAREEDDRGGHGQAEGS
jgi:hypothetical protein